MIEKEYESKSLLIKNDFYKLMQNFVFKYDFDNLILNNYYFDTLDEYFKNNNSALRIRIINDTKFELTLKINKKSFNEEHNIIITKNDFEKIINEKSINLKQFQLPINKKTNNLSINKMTTIRKTFKHGDITYCLDKCFYNNSQVDYELEIESDSIEKSEKILNNILDKNNIIKIKSEPKIKRLFKKK